MATKATKNGTGTPTTADAYLAAARAAGSKVSAKGFSFEKPGQILEGIFKGKGKARDLEDKGTGETKRIETWRVDAARALDPDTGEWSDVGDALLNESWQLNDEFQDIEPDAKIGVVFLGQENTGKGRRVNMYSIVVH